MKKKCPPRSREQLDRKNAASRAKYASDPVFRAKTAAKTAAWRAANPEQKKASSAAWAAAHPEQVKASAAAWAAAHPEQKKAAAAAWRAANPEKISVKNSRYYHAKVTTNRTIALFALQSLHLNLTKNV